MPTPPDLTPPGATPGQRPNPDTSRTPDVDRDADKPDRQEAERLRHEQDEQTRRDQNGPQTRQGG